jgi:REP element-mobilizing transposase RayT
LRHTPHRARAKHQRGNPVHVTLRACSRSLRSQYVARTVLRAIRDSNGELFRIAHHSVQENHLHLIVEAESTQALASGVRGLEIRIAQRVNRLLFRRGRFWADRWHGRALDGFSRPIPSEFRSVAPPGMPPRTRLLAVGWKRRGLIDWCDGPARSLRRLRAR